MFLEDELDVVGSSKGGVDRIVVGDLAQGDDGGLGVGEVGGDFSSETELDITG